MKREVEIPDGLPDDLVEAAFGGVVAALQRIAATGGGQVLVLPVPADFPMEHMPGVAAEFAHRLGWRTQR